MRYVVYDGLSDVYDRRFQDGKFIYLRKGVVTTVSEELFKILADSKKSNRITEVTGLDKLSHKNLKEV